jgi:glyoxylase-like metal-dependent hydrolase (beta-lactamase superfamily II)
MRRGPFSYHRPVSEPQSVATEASEIAPGVWHWHLHDERINFVGSAHAVRGEQGVVLIDPLPLVPEALESLGPVEAIALTTSSHQRSSWRLRRELGVRVHAPAAVKEVEEEPDVRYSEGDRLPGGLLAIFTPGAGTFQHSLLLEREGGVLFTPDLFARPPGAPLKLLPAEFMHDPEQARRTAEQLLGYRFSILCTGHGEPVLEDAKGALSAALDA